MADIAKLKKNLQKSVLAVAEARSALNGAIENYGGAERMCAVAREELENAEAMEMARDLRKKAE